MLFLFLHEEAQGISACGQNHTEAGERQGWVSILTPGQYMLLFHALLLLSVKIEMVPSTFLDDFGDYGCIMSNRTAIRHMIIEQLKYGSFKLRFAVNLTHILDFEDLVQLTSY